MKKLIFIATITVIMFASCTKDNNSEISLSDQEKSDLIFLRQEEKLAHDVYVMYTLSENMEFLFLTTSPTVKIPIWMPF